jgi:hypothetical protein
MRKKVAEETANSLPSLGDDVVHVPLERAITADSDPQIGVRVLAR